VKLGATDEEINGIVKDLRLWRDDQDGWYAIMNCEVISFV
jgi:hypothetical protein